MTRNPESVTHVCGAPPTLTVDGIKYTNRYFLAYESWARSMSVLLEVRHQTAYLAESRAVRTAFIFSLHPHRRGIDQVSLPRSV